MTPEQQQDYLKRSKDTKIFLDNIIENEHGFMSWCVSDNKFVPLQVYGDGVYWQQQIENMTQELGLNSILIGTRRSPKAYIHKYGYKLVGYILEKEVQNG